MIRRWLALVRVLPLEPRGPGALLIAGNLVLPCRIGRNGATHDKREGDGMTPSSTMRILQGFWRADRRLPPRTGLPMRPIRRDDGWCDAPGHSRYNRPVRLPFAPSHERMMRLDGQYDVVLDLDWNRGVRRQGRGSAIFLHIMNQAGKGSAGCVTVPKSRIDALMARLGPRTILCIVPTARRAKQKERSDAEPLRGTARRAKPKGTKRR